MPGEHVDLCRGGTRSPGSTPTPEEDIELARRAKSQGELPHAAFHVGCALSADPSRREWIALLDELIAEAGDRALDLAPLTEQTYFATAAVRAHVLARRRELREAIGLMLQVVRAQPEVPYMEWIFSWLEPKGAVESLDPATGNALLGTYLARFPGVRLDSEDERTLLARMLPVAERMRTAHPTSALTKSLSASLLRKLDRFDLATELAQAAHEAEPGWHTAIEVALAHRAQGDLDRALAAYRIAHEFDREDLTTFLDMADLLLEHGKLADAAAIYEQVLEKEPGQPWAEPSYYYLRYRLDQKIEWNDKLQEVAARSPDNARAAGLSRAIAFELGAYVGYLPDPSDATINALKQLRAQIAADPSAFDGESIHLTLSHLEAPSARLAFELEIAGLGIDLCAEFGVENVQSPDPRLPRGPVDFVLWRYEGNDPSPAVEEPPREVADAVADLAEHRFDRRTWLDLARVTAGRLGSKAYHGLIGTMVHPPPVREGVTTWEWVARVQFASALLLAHLDSGWDRSLRKKALLSILNGPVDWAIDAAVFALTEIALQHRDAEGEILRRLRGLLTGRPAGGYCCFEYALVTNLLRLPGITREERTALEVLRNELEGGSAS